MPTRDENEFLASMLEWERAPVLPIRQWFQPSLNPPAPESLNDQQLHNVLWDTIQALFAKRIVLDYTHHLSDRQLYRLIYRDILPSLEKKDRAFSHLFALAVYRSGNGSEYLASLLRLGGRTRVMGERESMRIAASRIASVSATGTPWTDGLGRWDINGRFRAPRTIHEQHRNT